MLEKVWYEISPIAYSIMSCIAMFYTNMLGVVFASLLLTVSVLIGVMRIQSRSAPNVLTKGAKTKAITGKHANLSASIRMSILGWGVLPTST